MVFVFLVLWTIAALLIVNNPYKDSMRWAALIPFCGGFGGFARAVIENFVPYLKDHSLAFPSIDDTANNIYNIGSFVNTNGLPYAYLMFAVSYTGYFPKKTKTALAWLCSIPVFLMVFYTPFVPKVQHDYGVLILWVGPYILAGTALLLHSLIRERNLFSKRDRFVAVALSVPPVMSQLIWNYVLRLFGFSEVWRLNTITIAVLFVFFLLFSTKYDVFGFKLRVERQRLQSTMKAITSGAVFLNHSIKNEVLKINLCNEAIRDELQRLGHRDDILKWSRQMEASTDHLLEIVNRIQHHMQNIVLKEEAHSLLELIDDSLKLVEPYLWKSQSVVRKQIHPELSVLCDRVHMMEVFNNLFTNAIEAMGSAGTLEIYAATSNQHLSISITDNGAGIPEDQLRHVFDPFFSTKKEKLNLGLGLSYCYNVMQRHEGDIEIRSVPSKGATVTLRFPKKRVVSLQPVSRIV